MSAERASIRELIEPYTTERPAVSPLIGLGVRLAILRHDVEEMNRCWEEFWRSPFATDAEAERAEDYKYDEVDG